jgi:hypothetical protein
VEGVEVRELQAQILLQPVLTFLAEDSEETLVLALEEEEVREVMVEMVEMVEMPVSMEYRLME